ncbi:MAG: hypothetical protein ACI86H_001687 [bacterium]|jgi:hypothetical protein
MNADRISLPVIKKLQLPISSKRSRDSYGEKEIVNVGTVTRSYPLQISDEIKAQSKKKQQEREEA